MDAFTSLQQLKNLELVKCDPWHETEYAPQELKEEDFDQCPDCDDWTESTQLKRDGVCYNCIKGTK